MTMKIALAADHRGFVHKEYLKKINHFSGITISWLDLGTHVPDRTDYPLYARKAVHTLQNKHADAAILLCGTGIGMAITANRHAGIYAGVVWNVDVARAAKEEDNVNMLVIPSTFVTEKEVKEIVNAWLEARFKGGRYQERLHMTEQTDMYKD